MSSTLAGRLSTARWHAAFVLILIGAIAASACSRDAQAAKQKYIESGDSYTAAGKLPEAVIEYRNAVQQDPRAGDARAKLANAYVSVGDGGHALEEFVRASDLLPEDSDVHLKTAGLMLLARRFDDAKLWAEKVLAKDPSNLQAQILLANSLAGLKDFDAAVAEIEEAIRLNPGRGETYSSLGALELNRGQKDAAERAFKKAVELDSKSANARLSLANFYWADSQWDAAETELRKVLELEPGNALAHRALATFYVARNRGAEAEDHLKKVRDLTKSPAAALSLADYYASRNDDAAARPVLQSLEGTAAASTAEVRLAILDRGAGEKEAAYQRLARVLEKDSTHLAALLAKIGFLSTDGRLEEAASAASLAAEKHQDSAEALFVLGGVQAARHQTDAAIAAYEGVLRLNPRATEAKVALSRLHLGARRTDASLRMAQDASASEPQSPAAKVALVRAQLAKRDTQGAQAELDVLVKQFPDSATVMTLVGILKGLKQDVPGSRKAFERALSLNPDSTEAIGGLLVLDLNAKKPQEARARIDERLAKTPTDPVLLMLAARTYAASGGRDQAEAFLRRAIQADPGYLDAYGALAQLYVSAGRLDAALQEFDQLAKREARPVAALTFAGMILQGQGKTADARDRFARALEIDSEAPVAANNLAWLYTEDDATLDRAMDLALRAKIKLPDRAEVNDTVGWIHYRKEQPSQAIPYFQQSIDKDAGNPVYHYHLGLAHLKNGDAAGGRQALQQALALKSDFQGAADARRVLTSLGTTP